MSQTPASLVQSAKAASPSRRSVSSVAGSFTTEESIQSLCRDLSEAFRDPTYSDVTLTHGDSDYSFPAHRVILASRCPFFDRIFRNAGSATTIDLAPYLRSAVLDPASLDIVFSYLYNGSLNITSRTVLDVYGMCTTMQLASAEAVCNSYINQMIDSRSVCDLLLAAIARKKDKLVLTCFRAIEDNTDEAMDSEEFLDLPETVVLGLLKNENLSCTEKSLFEGLLRWWCANKDHLHPGTKSEQDEYLMTHLLFFIRYPLMSPQELEEIEKMKLLPSDLILDAYRYHACAEFDLAALTYLDDEDEDEEEEGEEEGRITSSSSSSTLTLTSSGKFRMRPRGQRAGFVWNSKRIGTNMSLIDPAALYDLSINQPNIQKYQIGMVSKGFDHGVHFWEIEILASNPSSHIMIGVATENVYLTQWLGQDSAGWSWFGFNGTKYHGGKSPAYANGSKFGEVGQVVGVKLDLRDRGVLSFYLDGKPLGAAFDSLKLEMGKGKKLFPAVSFRTSGDAIRLRAKKLKYREQYRALLSHTDE